MKVLYGQAADVAGEPPVYHANGASERQARQGNRRRLLVFASVTALALTAGQSWNFARDDLYEASSRWQLVVPDSAGAATAASPAAGREAAAGLATPLQLVTSRPLLAQAAAALVAAGQRLPAGEAGAARLQLLLDARQVPGSDVLQLRATGPDPALLAGLLDVLPDLLRNELAVRQSRSADERLADARQELARLDQAATQRRSQLDQYRRSAGVLAEREDNEVVARSKGLAQALNTAIEKAAAAEARQQALAQGVTAGRSGATGREDPVLNGLEARASGLREELRDLERTYTPAFMAMDPKAQALRARLAELERQVLQQREAFQQAALRAADDEVASTRANVQALRARQVAARPVLAGVSGQLGQAKLLEDDLAQLDKSRRELLDRAARLQADARRGQVALTVLEAPVQPRTPVAPDRLRDGLWVLGGALLLGLLVMALVELFNRQAAVVPATAGATLVMPGWGAPPGAGWPAMPGPAAAQRMLASPEVWDATAAPGQGLLAAPAPAVLSQPEAAALLAAARGHARWLAAAALMGLTVTELLALQTADVDGPARLLRVRGPWARALPLPAWLADSPLDAAQAQTPLLHDAAGQALAEPDLDAMLAAAALDAGLPQGAALRPEALRATCIAWLVGQGLRFSDLPGWVGRVSSGQIAALATQGAAAASTAPGPDGVALLMPALQLPPPAA